MIRWKDVKMEVNKLKTKAKEGKDLTDLEKLNVLDLILKMVRDMRVNQRGMMKALNVPESKPRTEVKKEEEEKK